MSVVDHQQPRRKRSAAVRLFGAVLTLALVAAAVWGYAYTKYRDRTEQAQVELNLPTRPQPTQEESYLYGPLAHDPKPEVTFVIPANGEGTFWGAVRDKALPALSLPTSGNITPEVDAEADRIAGNVLLLAYQQLPINLDNLPAETGGYPVTVRVRASD